MQRKRRCRHWMDRLANMKRITLIATAKFGLEALVKREVEALGFEDLRVSDGRIEFEATVNDIP
ncbi:MAG: hypothetical protein ACK2UJ_16930, partial [Candidatus Promineifilaceae bacterium]